MKRRNKAVFLDRDGTINADRGYIYRIEDFELLPGVLEALKALQDAGFLLVIVSNQSGIARGYYSEEDLAVLNARMLKEFESKGIHIDGIYYCPHHPDAVAEKYRIDCDCRKPKTGMYERAVRELDIDLDGSYAIGDRMRDCSICNKETGCHGFLTADSEKPEIIEAVKAGRYDGIEYAASLPDAACRILGKDSL